VFHEFLFDAVTFVAVFEQTTGALFEAQLLFPDAEEQERALAVLRDAVIGHQHLEDDQGATGRLLVVGGMAGPFGEFEDDRLAHAVRDDTELACLEHGDPEPAIGEPFINGSAQCTC
jgi:hypothetical protein